MGQRYFPEGSECHQCRTQEKGRYSNSDKILGPPRNVHSIKIPWSTIGLSLIDKYRSIEIIFPINRKKYYVN